MDPMLYGSHVAGMRETNCKGQRWLFRRVARPVLKHAMDGLLLWVEEVRVWQVPGIESLQHLGDFQGCDQIQLSHWRIGA